MSRTITALFDQRAEAEAVKAKLEASSVHADHVRVHDQSSAGFGENAGSTHGEPGMWGSVKNAFLPDEDRHTYEEGLRRGGFLLTADVDEDQVDDVVRLLEDADTVDIDDRSQQWKSSGWNSTPATAATAATAGIGTDRAASRDAGEQVIPIVEEQLVVGKREVSRGGARVRSYVTETPVHEQIKLRDEKIDVQRRAVDRPLTDADNAFAERTIDMTATGEEAVVGKTARVVEEVVVSKSSDERVEQIDDTVRRTDVEIDRGSTGTRPDANRR